MITLIPVSNEIVWVDGCLVVEFSDGTLAEFVCDRNPARRAGYPDSFHRLLRLTKAALAAEVLALNRYSREAEQDATHRRESARLHSQTYR